MLPSSHEAPMMLDQPATDPRMLAAAFSDFIAASSRLERSYRDLQTEVTELSQALSERNRALLESQSENRAIGERLQRILETIPCGVLVTDQNGMLELANPEADRLLALCLSEDDDKWQGLPTALTGVMRLHQANATEEAPEHEILVDGAGEAVWLSIRCVHVLYQESASKSSGTLLWTLRDISAHKLMEAEKEAARDALALAQMSALLAHEIRNPLASMELFAGLIEDSPERTQEWLFHLRAGIRSLSGTVNNVLTLHGGTALVLEPMDVLMETTLAIAFLQPMARQQQVLLMLDARMPQQNPSLKIQSHRSAYQQILMNLCANALRYTSARGEVQVVIEVPSPKKESVRVSVIDSGCGIPEEHIPHLFRAGFSGSGTTSGLGLAVCERLAYQLGGDLHVISRLHHGSTFTLELPVA